MRRILTSIALIFSANLIIIGLDLSGVSVFPIVRAQCFGCPTPTPTPTPKPIPTPTPTPRPTPSLPPGTLDLKAYGAVGDGIADDGPALQRALNALANTGGKTLLVPEGRYAIITPVQKDFKGKLSSVTLRASESPVEFVIKAGEEKTALTLQSLSELLIENITFIGDQEVITDAYITLALYEIEKAVIRNCEFYGLASHVEGGAIIYAYHSDLQVRDSFFWGCSTASALYTSVIQNVWWKGISVTNTIFIDYGHRPEFFSKTPLAPPYSWINIGNPAVLDKPDSKREVIIRDVFMDEGAFYGISCFEFDYLPQRSAPVELISISNFSMNVTNLSAGVGISLQRAERVLIDNARFGWSDEPHPAIVLEEVGNAILNLIECVKEANIIYADAATQNLTIINSIYKTLDSSAPNTRIITTTSEDNPVYFVGQQYLNVLGREPDPAELFYWADLFIQCGNRSLCINDRRRTLINFLTSSPSLIFTLSGRVIDSNGKGIPGAALNLTGTHRRTTQTDSNGYYEFPNLSTSGDYVVTLMKTHYTFSPLSQTFYRPNGNRIANFTGTLNSYTISGTVTEGTNPLKGVTVTLDGDQKGTVTTTDTGTFSFTVNAGGNYIIRTAKTNYAFNPPMQTFNDLSGNQSANFTGTLLPVLLTQGDSPKAIAIDSTTWMRDPFSIISILNFSSDHRTRIALFAVNINELSNENISEVSAQAEDARHNIYPLTVEYLGKVPEFNWLTMVIVKLPDELSAGGDVQVSVTVRGLTSNKAIISIKPSARSSLTPVPEMRAQDVVWTNLVDTTATGNSLEKTAGCDGCWAGAISQQMITAGGGYVEFTVTQADKRIWAGLSNNGKAGVSGADIDFAVSLNSAGWAEVREDGVYRRDTRYIAGDVFRIAIEGGVVKYSKNGLIFYESKVVPTYPLLMDAAITSLRGIISNARIAASF